MAGYRTALGRARGLGSAKHGVGHFIAERVTSVALAPLSLWLIWFCVEVARGGWVAAQALLSSPVQAALASLTLVVGLYHAMIGMRVVIEDYIHKTSTKAVLLILNTFVGWAAAAVGVVSLLKIAFTAAP
ncbi:MAG TPA: succinate dehydrogenase, hydrophobic membrane anchor protein [Caulobacteraceae bacterium]|jgi:succinate dehydrogenase / fumarate reductase membrane anchor subunit|nr:succinate dehydrogenase, hydrophobic membrane anchor protein [Caulobacteraceae bacterium]